MLWFLHFENRCEIVPDTWKKCFKVCLEAFEMGHDFPLKSTVIYRTCEIYHIIWYNTSLRATALVITKAPLFKPRLPSFVSPWLLNQISKRWIRWKGDFVSSQESNQILRKDSKCRHLLLNLWSVWRQLKKIEFSLKSCAIVSVTTSYLLFNGGSYLSSK